MLELVLIVCLSAKPDKCDTIYLRDAGPGSMMQCIYNGAKQAAKWAEDHPGFVVRRWSCGYSKA